jgi:small subunit ribosomal protein S10
MKSIVSLTRQRFCRLGAVRLYSSEAKSPNYVDDTKDYNKGHLYPKHGEYIQSSTEVVAGIGRPSPVNVELNKYAPLKHQPEHKDLVAQVQFRSFSHQDMDFFVDFALRAAFYLKIPVVGPSYMPKAIKRWTVIKSPFAHAKAKQNFERITYRRMLKLYDANPEVIQIFLSTLVKYSIGGVGIDAKLFTAESLDLATKLDTPPLEEGPLDIKSVNLSAVDQKLADTVLKILKDPVFEKHLESDTMEKLVGGSETDKSLEKNTTKAKSAKKSDKVVKKQAESKKHTETEKEIDIEKQNQARQGSAAEKQTDTENHVDTESQTDSKK